MPVRSPRPPASTATQALPPQAAARESDLDLDPDHHHHVLLTRAVTAYLAARDTEHTATALAPAPTWSAPPSERSAPARSVTVPVTAPKGPGPIATVGDPWGESFADSLVAAMGDSWCPQALVEAVCGHRAHLPRSLAADLAWRAMCFDLWAPQELPAPLAHLLTPVPWFLPGFSSSPRLEALSDRICFAHPLSPEQEAWIEARHLEALPLAPHPTLRLVDPTTFDEAAARIALGWLPPCPAPPAPPTRRGLARLLTHGRHGPARTKRT